MAETFDPPSSTKPPKPEKVSAVIFDWDFTITQRGGEFFFRGGDGKAKAMVKNIITATVGHFPKPISDGRKAVESAIRSAFPTELRAGIKELLTDMTEKGIPVFIVSNGDHELVSKEIEEMLGSDLAKKIHFQGKEVGKPQKPQEEAIRSPLVQHGIPIDNHVLFVGDSFENDIIPAHKCGITPILIGCNKNEVTKTEKFNHNVGNPVTIIHGFHELRELVFFNDSQIKR
jgi:HAD superfamily hydrolase (TIGR01549 family)